METLEMRLEAKKGCRGLTELKNCKVYYQIWEWKPEPAQIWISKGLNN